MPRRIWLLLVPIILVGMVSADRVRERDLTSRAVQNDSAYIPAQCYTDTTDDAGIVRNSCYTCHTRGLKPNRLNDFDLQMEYIFPSYAETNRWTNLYVDWSDEIARRSDAQTLAYVRESNYFDRDGDIAIAARLDELPAAWDNDGNGRWSGFTPDAYFSFDDDGFDRLPGGGYSGWRAFGYYPFPSTHWPTNGSMSDVLVRLPEAFRTRNGVFDLDTYRVNFAIIETLIGEEDIEIDPVDENRWGVDLDKDGSLGTARIVRFDWEPLEDRFMYYVGDARDLQAAGSVHLAAGLFPEGTEFLQTLRYFDVTDRPGGEPRVAMADRIKEIRYMRKARWLTYAEIEMLVLDDYKEADDFPDRLDLPIGNMEDGLSNGMGWRLQGFIEAADGTLRPQTLEETFSCIGCHGGVGANTDSTFSFARKFDEAAPHRGWTHWTQYGLEGVNEPKVEFDGVGVQYEYSFYLMYNGAGDEYRANREVSERFFDERGFLRNDAAQALHRDVSTLLYPSIERAMRLNKAYRGIVARQAFIYGRDVILDGEPPVYESVDPDLLVTGVETPVILTEHPRAFGRWENQEFPQSVDRWTIERGPTVEGAIGGSGAPGDEGQRVRETGMVEGDPSARVSEEGRATVNGNGMAGPGGEQYEVDWDGFIDQSRYVLDTPGFYFPFPNRSTLPTRIIVPIAQIPSCYECHRIPTNVPANYRDAAVGVSIPEIAARTAPGLTQLTTDRASDINPEWSPDGRWIAFESDRSGTFQVWIVSPDSGELRRLTTGPERHGWGRWSPDGREIVVWAHDDATGRSAFKIVDVETGAGQTVVESEWIVDRAAWSPDGRYLAYASNVDNNWDIYLVSRDGRERYRLTTDGAMDTNPLWRPDGELITYKVARTGEYNLTFQRFISFENGFADPTIHDWGGIEAIQAFDWSPDGTRISYTAEIVTPASGEDLVSYAAVVEDIDVRGGRTINGTPVNLSTGHTLGDRSPRFSPSSDRVAFWAWGLDYRPSIWIADVDGGNLRQVTSGGYDMYPVWSPDGRRLAFFSHRAGNNDIWIVDLAR